MTFPIMIFVFIIIVLVLVLAFAGVPMSVEYVYVAFELHDPKGLEKALDIKKHHFKKAKFLEEDDEDRLLLILHVAIAKLPFGNIKIPSVVISSYLEPSDPAKKINGYVIHRYYQPYHSQAMFPEITDFAECQVSMEEHLDEADKKIISRTIKAKVQNNGKVLLHGEWRANFSNPVRHLADVRFGNRNGWIHTITGVRNNVYSPVSAPSVYACDTVHCSTDLPFFSDYIKPQPVAAVTHKPGTPFKWYIRVFRMIFDQIVHKKEHL
jgi:hypothetical protein